MSRRRNVNHFLKKDRERKYRLQGKGGRGDSKFIPAPDREFAHMAREFANHVTGHAERFAISPGQVEKLNAAVEAYRLALSRSLQRDTAWPRATSMKNDAREEAEKIVRAVARSLRACESLNSTDRIFVNMKERPRRVKSLQCPQIAPELTFVGVEGGRHILEYGNDFDRLSNAKPKGASRLELFVELVPDCKAAELPQHPAERSGGKLWYLRSFTTSRMEVEFPVCTAGPMRVLYWGRWCDTKGNVGPFSKTCVARVEGGLIDGAKLLQAGVRFGSQSTRIQVRDVETMYVIVETPYALTDQRAGDLETTGAKMLPAA